MKNNIRKATFDDILDLLEIFKTHLNESKFSKHSFDNDKAIYTVSNIIATEDSILYVATEDEKIIGYMAGGYTGNIVADYTYTYDYGFYVLPKFRDGKTAAKLIMKFIKWAQNKKVDYITVVNNTYEYDKTGGVDKFLKRMGFEVTAGIYEYREVN